MKYLFFTFLLASSSWAQSLTHEALDKFVQANPNSLIFVWSPYMPLSKIGRDEIIELSQKCHFPLLTIRSISIASSQLVTQDVVMNENLFDGMGVDFHYPAMLVVLDGKIDEKIIYGYEVPEGVLSFLREIYHFPLKGSCLES